MSKFQRKFENSRIARSAFAVLIQVRDGRVLLCDTSRRVRQGWYWQDLKVADPRSCRWLVDRDYIANLPGGSFYATPSGLNALAIYERWLEETAASGDAETEAT